MGIKDRLKRKFFGADLAKLKIEREQQGIPAWVDVFTDAPKLLFNPSEITLTKKTHWNQATQNDSDTGAISFAGGEPTEFQIDLFFDTYEGVPGQLPSLGTRLGQTILGAASLGNSFSLAEPEAVSVTTYTNRIRKLTQIDYGLGRPPLCKLSWGQFNYDERGLIFIGYLTSLSQRFTLFMPDGMPVRAILSCTFEEFLLKSEAQKANPGASALEDDPIRVVRQGETLSSIAQDEYGDPSLWRPIAQVNGLHNPRSLQPGQVLTIPVLNPAHPARVF